MTAVNPRADVADAGKHVKARKGSVRAALELLGPEDLGSAWSLNKIWRPNKFSDDPCREAPFPLKRYLFAMNYQCSPLRNSMQWGRKYRCKKEHSRRIDTHWLIRIFTLLSCKMAR